MAATVYKLQVASHFCHNEIPALSLLRTLIGPVIPAENNSYRSFSKWICKNSDGNLSNPLAPNVVLTML